MKPLSGDVVPVAESVDLAGLSIAELEAELVAGAWSAHGTRYRLLKLLAAYDDSGGWIAHGATCCAVWWSEVCGVARNTAREHVRVARARDAICITRKGFMRVNPPLPDTSPWAWPDWLGSCSDPWTSPNTSTTTR